MARQYALHRNAPGDYIAFSNDLTTRYRVHAYEDGRVHGLDVPFERRRFWRIAQMPASVITPELATGDPWHPKWVEVDWNLPTMKAALAKVGLE